MMARLWHDLRSRLVTTLARKPDPFTTVVRRTTARMDDARCAAITQTRESLHAQQRDRERTNWWADDQFAGPPPPERRDR